MEICIFIRDLCFFLQVANQGRVADPNITKYNVKVMPVSVPTLYSLLPLFRQTVAHITDHDYLYFEQSLLSKSNT